MCAYETSQLPTDYIFIGVLFIASWSAPSHYWFEILKKMKNDLNQAEKIQVQNKYGIRKSYFQIIVVTMDNLNDQDAAKSLFELV